MNLSIGEKIKKLRRENDITQEKLADYLNISYQAVSKWENGSSLPDISMIIPLANFFGVTTDVLFDMDTQKQTQEIEAIYAESGRLCNKGMVKENLALMREAVAKYPNNFGLLTSLAYALSNKENDENNVELIKICERILEDCNDNGHRSSAIQLLTFTYSNSGNVEKALEYANKANSFWTCAEVLTCHAYKDPKAKTEYVQLFNHYVMDQLMMQILFMMTYDNPDDKIFAYETALKMWELFIYDGNYLFYHCRIAEIYDNLSQMYAAKQDKIKTLEALELTVKHSLLYESIPEGTQYYTSIFAGGTHNNTATSTNSTNTAHDNLKELFAKECFDFIRNDPEFIALI